MWFEAPIDHIDKRGEKLSGGDTNAGHQLIVRYYDLREAKVVLAMLKTLSR